MLRISVCIKTEVSLLEENDSALATNQPPEKKPYPTPLCSYVEASPHRCREGLNSACTEHSSILNTWRSLGRPTDFTKNWWTGLQSKHVDSMTSLAQEHVIFFLHVQRIQNIWAKTTGLFCGTGFPQTWICSLNYLTFHTKGQPNVLPP